MTYNPDPKDTDPRVTCNDCRRVASDYRGRYCADHVRAGLGTAPIGPDFMGMLQRCLAFVAKPARKAAA